MDMKTILNYLKARHGWEEESVDTLTDEIFSQFVWEGRCTNDKKEHEFIKEYLIKLLD